MSKKMWIFVGVMFALSTLAVRIVPHAPNLVPVGALALWAGAYLNKRMAVPLIVGVMLLGDAHDLLSGQYSPLLPVVVYGAMLFYVPLGAVLSHRMVGGWRIVAPFAGVFIGSLIFFVLTNGAVWAFGNWYPKTAVGLVACLAAGIPFLRNSLVANTEGVTIFFGATALLLSIPRIGEWRTARQTI